MTFPLDRAIQGKGFFFVNNNDGALLFFIYNGAYLGTAICLDLHSVSGTGAPCMSNNIGSYANLPADKAPTKFNDRT